MRPRYEHLAVAFEHGGRTGESGGVHRPSVAPADVVGERAAPAGDGAVDETPRTHSVPCGVDHSDRD
jgi:hypothetical protein